MAFQEILLLVKYQIDNLRNRKCILSSEWVRGSSGSEEEVHIWLFRECRDSCNPLGWAARSLDWRQIFSASRRSDGLQMDSYERSWGRRKFHSFCFPFSNCFHLFWAYLYSQRETFLLNCFGNSFFDLYWVGLSTLFLF